MTTSVPMRRTRIYRQEIEDDLKPYATLFLRPLTKKKSAFSKGELEEMCRDPLHSPRLIRYLINFVKHM